MYSKKGSLSPLKNNQFPKTFVNNFKIQYKSNVEFTAQTILSVNLKIKIVSNNLNKDKKFFKTEK